MKVYFGEKQEWRKRYDVDAEFVDDATKEVIFRLAWEALGAWLLSEYGPDVAALQIELERGWPSEGEIENALSNTPSAYFDKPMFKISAVVRRYFYR